MINLKGNIGSVEERAKFNNLRMLVLTTFLAVEQFAYGMFFSDSSSKESRVFFVTAGISFIYTLMFIVIRKHNKKYDNYSKDEIKKVRGFFATKDLFQYSYVVFLIGISVYRAVYVSMFSFSIPVIYIAVLYGVSFLFYYPPIWTATLYIVSATLLIILSRSVNAGFLYDNFAQDVIINNILAWLGSLLSYQRFGKQVEAVDMIKTVNKDKDELIQMRDTIIDISGKVAVSHEKDDLYQYILKKCMTLVPNALFGSILMFKDNGLLGIKAHVGFNNDEVGAFELPLEEAFLYIATEGKMDKTLIINRISGVLKADKMVGAGEEDFPVKAEIASPLIVDGKLLGIIGIDCDREDAFSEKDVYVIDYLTKQVAQVIRQQRLYDEVLQLSRYDSLTNLYNRYTFDKIVDDDLENCKKEKNTAYFAIIDLDGLKAVNDVYGHAAGDEMIQRMAREFYAALGKIGDCARYGGDEFVFYTSKSSEEEILKCVTRIKKELESHPIRVDKDEFIVRFSFGMCSTHEVGYSPARLYNHADKKMYEEKEINKRRNKL
jgi:diguanylate cyclase (GGDEF)-like protein